MRRSPVILKDMICNRIEWICKVADRLHQHNIATDEARQFGGLSYLTIEYVINQTVNSWKTYAYKMYLRQLYA
jgi:hypothetical protein